MNDFDILTVDLFEAQKKESLHIFSNIKNVMFLLAKLSLKINVEEMKEMQIGIIISRSNIIAAIGRHNFGEEFLEGLFDLAWQDVHSWWTNSADNIG